MDGWSEEETFCCETRPSDSDPAVVSRQRGARQTDLGGSEPPAGPGDTGTGLTQGDRRLRWRSRTAAGTAARGDLGGRLEEEERSGEREPTALRNEPPGGR